MEKFTHITPVTDNEIEDLSLSLPLPAFFRDNHKNSDYIDPYASVNELLAKRNKELEDIAIALENQVNLLTDTVNILSRIVLERKYPKRKLNEG